MATSVAPVFAASTTACPGRQTGSAYTNIETWSTGDNSTYRVTWTMDPRQNKDLTGARIRDLKEGDILTGLDVEIYFDRARAGNITFQRKWQAGGECTNRSWLWSDPVDQGDVAYNVPELIGGANAYIPPNSREDSSWFTPDFYPDFRKFTTSLNVAAMDAEYQKDKYPLPYPSTARKVDGEFTDPNCPATAYAFYSYKTLFGTCYPGLPTMEFKMETRWNFDPKVDPKNYCASNSAGSGYPYVWWATRWVYRLRRVGTSDPVIVIGHTQVSRHLPPSLACPGGISAGY